jgi:hypothetical protein
MVSKWQRLISIKIMPYGRLALEIIPSQPVE